MLIRWLLLMVMIGFVRPALSIRCADVLRSSFAHYKIPAKAQQHIFDGDITHSGPPGPKIKGGLHTFKGLLAFLAKRPDIKRLHEGSSTNWVHYLADPSGVVHVRLPSSAYTKKSLKNLLASDLSMKNGYLWKTLFPESMTRVEIFNSIKGVLASPEKVESLGWATRLEARVEHQGKSFWVTVIVSPRTQEVISAYPRFEQQRGYKNPMPVGKMAVVNNMLMPKLTKFGIRSKEEFDHNVKSMNELTEIIQNHGGDALWRGLPPGVGLALARVYLLPRSTLATSHPYVDMVYFRSHHNGDSRYKHGTYMALSAELFRQVLKDPDVPQSEKFEIAKALIDNLLVNESTLVADFIWIKMVVNSIIRSEAQFSKAQFYDLLWAFIDRRPSGH